MNKIIFSTFFFLFWVAHISSLAQSNPYMVADMNTEQDYTVGSNPSNFTLVGTKTYFTTGLESSLWMSDGTEAGTTQIMGISNVHHLVNVNGTLYFVATTEAAGEELYKYDGTTLTLINIESGTASSSPSALTNVNGTLYFIATTAAAGIELYKYTGTGTTATLIEIEIGVDSSNPTELIGIGSTLYFKATTTATGEELYKYTGTTLTLLDIEVGVNSSNPEYLTNVNGTLYFTAYTTAQGTEVRKYAGTGTSTSVIDVEIGSGDAYPYKLTNVNGVLYFVATTINEGTELYKYAGTGSTATLIEIEAGVNGSNPNNLIAVNSTLYFVATTTNEGTELYKYDGTTITLIDIELGIDSSSPNYLTNVNGTLYFVAYTLANGEELYKYDGTNYTLIDVEIGGDSSYPEDLTAVGSTLFFSASTFTDGVELYKHTGASATATLLEIATGDTSTYPENLTNINGTLYFSAETITEGNEPWKSNGTQVGTQLIKDIGSYGGSDSPEYLTVISGNMYYVATTPNEGRELRKYNGTTTTLIEIEVGAESANPEYLTNVNGTLYFAATTTANGRELYKYDGTNYSLINIEVGAASSSPEYLTNVNGTLYFVATTLSDGTELYKYDGTNYTLIDVEAGADNSNPQNLTNVNGTLYFTATTLANGIELYKYDGTTLTLIEIETGTDSSDPAYLTAVNSTLYFVATTAAAGDELYKYEGTGSTATLIEIEPGPGGSFPQHLTAINDTLYCSATTLNNGTELYKHSGNILDLIDIEVGLDNSNPSALTNVNGTLYFAATTTTNGNELYKYDGVNRTLLEVISGTEGISEVANLVSFNGNIYFSAYTLNIGTELYKTDGTSIGTSIVKDIWEGIYSSYPSNFTEFNGNLYFSADYNPSDSTYGIELWTLGNCTASNSIITHEGEHLKYNSQIQINPVTQSCHCDVFNQLVTSVNATGANPVTGSINIIKWIDTTTTASHVKCHYEFNPETAPTTATGKITLYFTQAEFNEFNAISTVDLPTNNTDISGKANLRIKKYNGISSDGTGAENTYTGSPIIIDPMDTDIVWNTTDNRWEVSFDAVGFGGFFAAIPPASSINVSLVTPPAFYCAGSTINTNYTSFDLTFNVGNTFTLQLSDASGSFTSPIVLKTVTSTATSGSISGMIPWAQSAGTGYRVRVVSSNTPFIGSDNSSNIEIKVSTATASINITRGTFINPTTSAANLQLDKQYRACEGDSIVAVANVMGSSNYRWMRNNSFLSALDNQPSISIKSSWGVYQLVAYDGNNCGAATDSIGFKINTAPLAKAGLDQSICLGSTKMIGGTTAVTGITYTWTPSSHLNNANLAKPTVLSTFNGTTTYAFRASKTYNELEVPITCFSSYDSTKITSLTLPAAPSLVASATNVCEGATAIVLTPSNTAGAASIQWLKNGTQISTTTNVNATRSITTSPANSGTYTARLTAANSCTSLPSNSVALTINAAPTPTVTSSVGTDINNIIRVCLGITNAVLSANVTGATPTFTWFNTASTSSIGTGGNLSLTNVSTTSKSYYVKATYVYSGLTCTRNSVSKTIRQDAVATNCRVIQNNTEELGENLLSIYPNPTENVLNAKIQVAEAGEATLILVNSLGQSIWQEQRNLEAGTTEVTLSLESLPIGIYHLILDKGEIHQTLKVVKE